MVSITATPEKVSTGAESMATPANSTAFPQTMPKA